MDIINTMCRISDLTKEQCHSLVESIPKSNYFDWGSREGLIGFDTDGDSGTWVGFNNTKIVTYTEMMQLLGKTMKEFTKSDLKTGMFVRNRGGDYKVVIGDVLSGLDACTTLGNFSDSLISNNCEGYDIVAVYEVKGTVYLRTYLNGSSLEVIWERIEQTPVQKEMEVLQAKMDELQEQMKVVKAKL
jgi:hypothetical protein